MAHNLKLAIYQLTVREKHKRSRLKFIEAFKHIAPEGKQKDELYKDFALQYYNSFNGRFSRSSDNKSIVPQDLQYQSQNNLIYGLIKGGLTDIERDIYELNNPKSPVDKLTKDRVATLPYFFFMWTPVDLDYGILMLQHYSSTSVSSSFVENFKDFFKRKGLTLTTYPYVPKKLKEKFYKSSTVKKVALISRNVSNNVRDKFRPLVTDEGDFEIVVELRRLDDDSQSFTERIKSSLKSASKLFNANLNDLGIETTEDYDMRIYYEDDTGKKSFAKLSNNFDILPTIDIPDEIKETGKDSPDPERIKEYCVNLLKGIQSELEDER